MPFIVIDLASLGAVDRANATKGFGREIGARTTTGGPRDATQAEILAFFKNCAKSIVERNVLAADREAVPPPTPFVG